MKTILLLLLLFPVVVLAQHTFTFTWTDPVQRTDGTALDPDAELHSYRLHCAGPETVERLVDREATEELDTGERRYEWTGAVQISGMYECSMTVFDTAERESPSSETVSVPKFAAPSAPTDLEAQ